MNKVILSLLLAGIGTQLIKIICIWVKTKQFSWKDFLVTGGMPSSHSAFVISLATILFLQEGFSSTFAVSLVLAVIVIRDAFGVRRTAGEEGMVLINIMKKLKMKQETHFSLGHTPLQVFVGSLIGFLVSIGVYYFI
ncbi:divergent PAP2 family protein [archaeon]|jgi:uncharacterized protein|nr:divergent PAP2 family protein [archaeon]MBT3451720.1 divergent PAP2 family protein [archaeon]MBT6869808.1 divergent PAP2 family protein [archaeon]MBT7192763.1 divergent PAP2 family protein [archaeon]MBT7380788.1 divergent PAP2 family protein [archaeon]